MARLYTMPSFALLVLVVPVESVAYGELAKLKEVAISVEVLGKVEKELGLSKEDIKNHVFVFLRSKLPRLKVSEINDPNVYISVTLGYTMAGENKDGYHGAVKVDVHRGVTIIKNKQYTLSPVWSNYVILSGQ